MKNILRNTKYFLVIILTTLTVFLANPCDNDASKHTQLTINNYQKVQAAQVIVPPPAAKPILPSPPPKPTLEEEFLQLEENISLHNRQLASRGTLPQNYNSSNGLLTLGDCEKLYSAGICHVSFYTPSVQECGSNRGITASGKPVTPGYSVAADTSKFPIGTLLYIQDWGIVEVMDRGGSVKGNRIDICVFDRATAFKFGVLKKEVWVCRVLETSAP